MRTEMFTVRKLSGRYYLPMGTKQHQSFCAFCAKITNHVTRYQKSDAGGTLVASVQCFEHAERPLRR